jgi:hypothetical protein
MQMVAARLVGIEFAALKYVDGYIEDVRIFVECFLGAIT